MPLQQISLDQSIYKKKDTNINRQQPSQRSGSSGSTGGVGHLTAAGMTEDSFTERQKQIWADQDKKQKEEREASMQQAQEIGMRVKDGLMKEQVSAQQQAGQQQQQAIQTKQQIEANPEPAAQEMYNLMKTLPDDAKTQLLNQLFTPTSSGSSISSGGKEVQVGGEKYNPLANVFLEKGWAMFDAKGQVNLSEPEREFEKGTFEIVEKGGKVYKFNTATNEEVELGSADDPEGMVNEVVKQAKDDAMEVVKADPSISLEDATHDALLDYNVPEDKAVEIAKFSAMPESSKGTKWYNDWAKGIVDWVKGRKPKEATKKDWEDAAKKTKESSFNEANVTSLTDVISDDVTPAERAHFMNAGATEADIDEAIKRKQGGK